MWLDQVHGWMVMIMIEVFVNEQTDAGQTDGLLARRVWDFDWIST